MSAGASAREASGGERREEIRDQLLAAMETLLASGEGDGELLIDRLVAQAGIGRSTFYKYFKDKGDLFGAWLELISAQLGPSPWLALGPELSPQQLHDVLHRLIDAYRPHAALMATLYDVARSDAPLAAAVSELERRGAADLARHIEAGQREGWIDPALLARETASWLSWLGERGQHQLLRGARSDAELTRLIAAYTDIVWNTLYAFAPARVTTRPTRLATAPSDERAPDRARAR